MSFLSRRKKERKNLLVNFSLSSKSSFQNVFSRFTGLCMMTVSRRCMMQQNGIDFNPSITLSGVNYLSKSVLWFMYYTHTQCTPIQPIKHLWSSHAQGPVGHKLLGLNKQSKPISNICPFFFQSPLLWKNLLLHKIV